MASSQAAPQGERATQEFNCTYVKLRAASSARHTSSKYPRSPGTVVTNGGSCEVRKPTFTLKTKSYNAHILRSDLHNGDLLTV
jgi:hypothetical protein